MSVNLFQNLVNQFNKIISPYKSKVVSPNPVQRIAALTTQKPTPVLPRPIATPTPKPVLMPQPAKVPMPSAMPKPNLLTPFQSQSATLKPSIKPSTPKPFVAKDLISVGVDKNLATRFEDVLKEFPQTIQNVGKTLQKMPDIQSPKLAGISLINPLFNSNETIRSAGRTLETVGQGKLGKRDLGGNVEDFMNIISVLPVGRITKMTAPALEPAIQLLRNKLRPEDINLIGKFAEIVETGGGKKELGQVGSDMSSLVKNVFGKNAETWSNQKVKNVFDLVLQKIGTKANRSGLGLSINDIRQGEKVVSDIGKGKGNLLEEQTGRISFPLAESATNKLKQTTQSLLKQPIVGGGQLKTSSGGSITDPVNKIIKALEGAKPIRGEQEAIYSKIRSKQAGALMGIGEKMGGEAGYYKKLGQLKGEMPKVQFESIKKQFTQNELDGLFNKIEGSNLGVFEKVNAQTGLKKLLGAEGGTIPTQSELKILNEVFPPEFIQAVLKNRSTVQKLFSLGTEALNLPRAIMATADLSAPLRQGVFLIGRPKQFVPAVGDMFKYAFSENAYKGLMEGIKTRPTYPLMRQSKLALTDMSPILASREEAFMSNLAEKIPLFGKVARGSNRAYSGFLNKLRADVFDDLVKSTQKQGVKVEGKALDDIARFVNSATGRGELGALQRTAPVLNGVFFSPRLMASRLNLLNPVYYANLTPVVRKEALKSLLTFAGTATTVLGLAKLGGADVSADPRNADFGKIKVGNTRYDILGGFQQYLRLAGQLITGQKINSQSGKLTTLGEGFGVPTRKDIITSFFESKTAPVASFATALLQGRDAVGNKFNLPTEVINRFIPMVISDMYDISKETGNPLGAIPAIFGTGVQTYGKTELVTGKNQFGDTTSQIKPVQGLGETITEKVFGRQPLGSSGSTNVETYYDQMLKMPKQQAAKQFDEISKTNPDLAKKILDVVKERKLGVTVMDKVIKAQDVASGDRAKAIVSEFNKLKTLKEKSDLWDHYVKVGVITEDVKIQLNKLMKSKKTGSLLNAFMSKV